ncbi:hypothetical protein [Thiomonas arsenitoxydans]|uniref:Uncharacterized protein n=1 Tax=Thiomonas arsenitoxydans (strain DSM 22701 / CIP 110005 / 3As) TaxID=426114 RepID=D6CTV9_THIA3|nr:hypothetical protein [Thiomonas arsenitoxydans]CAZ88728.1 hypothetical protein THI_2073 [Thiomonas arsenitoxydans]
MKLTHQQIEALADRFLAAGGIDLADLNADSLAELDEQGRSLRRRQRGSRIVGGGRPASCQSASRLTANLPAQPVEWGEEQEDGQEGFIQAEEEEQARDDLHLRELMDDFRALLDTHRLATRDRCTPRMAQIAAKRQRVALALHGDLLGFDDFHSLHQALYSIPPARRARTSRGVRGGPRMALPGQLSLLEG